MSFLEIVVQISKEGTNYKVTQTDLVDGKPVTKVTTYPTWDDLEKALAGPPLNLPKRLLNGVKKQVDQAGGTFINMA